MFFWKTFWRPWIPIKICKYQLRYYCNIRKKNNEKFKITKNIKLKNYNLEYTPTDSTVGVPILNKANLIGYKPRHNL